VVHHRDRLRRRAPQVVDAASRDLDAVQQRLALLDPVNLLRRGWSITRAADGTVLRSVAGLSDGDNIRTRLADGEIASRITGD
jgi:exodeoxyribonuclease VII large subunit